MEQLLADVGSWPETAVNWSEKAREYNINRKGEHQFSRNGGQIVKALLTANGVDLARRQMMEAYSKMHKVFIEVL